MEAKRVLVIGGGPGGYVAAIRASQLGAQVTLVEKQWIGGTCLNVGCIPTKCLLHSAELIEDIRHGVEIGIRAEGVEVDFAQVIAHKNKVSKTLSMGVEGLLRMNKVKKINGTAAFTAPGRVEILHTDGSREEAETDAIIVATGSINAVPPIPGIAENKNCIDSTGALSLEKRPESMVIVGGGVIGTELACAYAALGTKVSIVEAKESVLPMLDQDISNIGVKHMKKMGIAFYMSCPVQSVEASEIGAKVVCRDTRGEELYLEAEKVLIAVGRKANTAGLKLEAGGIKTERGAILVNDRMETNVAGVYAIGDCVYGRAQLAHTASAMGEVAAENIMGKDSLYNEKTNPTCVYMMPEAAAIGLTEAQAKEKGVAYRTGKFPLMANGKSLILNGGEGMVKMIASEESEQILGVQIIGPRATDLIAEGALAIQMQSTVNDLINTIHSHPTVSEAVREAALNVHKRAIHARNG